MNPSVFVKIVPVLVIVSVALQETAQPAPDEAETRLKNIHTAFGIYISDYDERYPPMSSPASQVPRTRWADSILPYTKEASNFTSPNAPVDMITRTFAHSTEDNSIRWGGFGYNYQYLGNSRSQEGNPNLPFGRPSAEITAPAQTVLVGETYGVRNDDGSLSTGVYVLDPPRPSERGTANASGFYAAGDACGSGPMGCRSIPAEWIPNRVMIVTIDGSLPVMSRARLDDLDGDGTLDNGWWNGVADPAKR